VGTRYVPESLREQAVFQVAIREELKSLHPLLYPSQ
jgi:hypothetical protein